MRSVSAIAPFGFSDVQFGHGQDKLPRIFVVNVGMAVCGNERRENFAVC